MQGPQHIEDRSGRGPALWAVLRASWRARWRSLVVLALMIGLTGGIALAALAGARRSSSSLDRFHDAGRTLDVFLVTDLVRPEPAGLAEVLDGPLVESHNDLAFVFVDIDSVGFFFAPTTRRALDIEQGVLLEGRRANPDAPDEVVLSEGQAGQLGLGVGDFVEAGTYSPAQAAVSLETGQFPTSSFDGPPLRLRVVGIIRNGFDLSDGPAGPNLTITTPAWFEKYGEQVAVGARSHMIRLAGGVASADRFTDAVTEVYGDERLPSMNVGQGESSMADAIGVVTAALVAVAFVILVAGTAWIAITAGRHERLAAADSDILRALGATPTDRRVMFFGAVAPGFLAGLLLAPLVAVALSPLLPVGSARRVDPDPGLHVDLGVLLVGTAALGIVLAFLFAVSAIRLVGTKPADVASTSVPRGVDRAARSLRPVPGTGVRFALHTPPRFAAPVRPALLGAGVGVIGLVAVAVIGASLQRLVDTPARWGTTWDVAVPAEALDTRALLDDPAVDAAAVLLYDEQVSVGGIEAISMTLDPVKSAIVPTVVEGREPRAADEIALGRDTFDDVGARIGATVTVQSRGHQSAPFRLVGVIAFPSVGEPTPVAIGVALTAAGGDRLDLGDNSVSDDVGTRYVVIRWAHGIDGDAELVRLGGTGGPVSLPSPAPEVQGLRDVNGFPMVVAAALALLGIIATSHALIVTVRRRRLELGIFSAIGFAPRQRHWVIVVQATTVALVALGVGVPLGVVVGRVVWSAIARSIGVTTDAALPLTALALGALGLVVTLNVIATIPAHSAARLRVAEALRSE
jgi:ABC-type lipoprotein release transport system permease subunit